MKNFDMPGPAAGYDARAGWIVRHLMPDLGLTMEQAAGFVGNPSYESGEFKKLQEVKPLIKGSRGGYGWSQWTGPRRRQFEGYAADHGLAASSDEANYGFMVAELRTEDWEGFMAHLRAAKTLDEACRLTYELYERPKEVSDGTFVSWPTRLQYARRALAAAQNAGVVDQPTGDSPDTTCQPVAQWKAQAIPAIKVIQATLSMLGLYAGKIDGDWGPQSEDALTVLLNYEPE